MGAVSLCAPNILRASTEIEVELCLLLDCSSSMFVEYTKHFQVQLHGHKEALLRSDIQESWLPYRPLVSVFVWADTVIPLFSMQMKSTDDFQILSQELLARAPVQIFDAGRTYHKEVLRYFNAREKTTFRRVLDISTDEAPDTEDQARCKELRDSLFASGTQINVLSIDSDGESTTALQDCLVTPNGFAYKIGGFKDYHAGIAAKMRQDLMM